MNKSTDSLGNLALLVLRVVAGAILFYYGSQKFLGWFGGPGMSATITAFSKNMGIPTPLTVLATVAEFFGGLGLVVGIFTRVAAFGAFCTMAVATFTQVRGVKTLVASADNMFPIKDATYPLALAAICLAILLLGAGDWSLDKRFFGRQRR
ncbi:MAG: DoxX family protein [Armatimonadetes bacterium]|nr:DoxX family protein [Armatimonadota bacterium]